MSYAVMLDTIIKVSDLSLRQIAKRCLDIGITITPSYISQLKNGKLPPPSEDISLALSRVCGTHTPAHLVFQGYLEKAPALVREYMLASSALNKIMLESLCKSSGDITPEFKSYIEGLDVLSSLEISSKFISIDDKSKALDLIREISLSTGKTVKIDESKDILHLFLPDTSMSPIIPVHSHVYVLPTRKDLLKDRDIIAFYPPNSKATTLRKLFTVKGKLLLIPEDKTHQLYLFNDFSEINYIGKVVSYKVDL
jgi:hypothetical protein